MDNPLFKAGDKVTIAGGTFDGCSGPIITDEEAATMPYAITASKPEEGALWVVIDIFGCKVPVQQAPERLRQVVS